MADLNAAAFVLPQHMTVGANTLLVEQLLPLAAGGEPVVLDASAVEVLSAAGAQALVALGKTTAERAATYTAASEPFKQALKEMGLSWLLTKHA